MAIRLTNTSKAAIDAGLKVLVYGAAGAGKTMLCATTGEPTVIISAEAGLLSLAGHAIPVLEVKTMEDVADAYRYLTQSEEGLGFRWVCLDSISEIAEVVLAREKSTAKDPRQAYGALADEMGRLVRAFRDLPRNVYFSSKMERTKDESTGITLYGPSMPGQKVGQQLPYFFDEVFALRVEPDTTEPQHPGEPPRVSRWLQTGRCLQYEAKDRSGRLGMYEPPSLAGIYQKIVAGTSPAEAEAA